MYGYEFGGRLAEEFRLEDGLLNARLGKSPVFQVADAPGVIERVEAFRDRLGNAVYRPPVMGIAREDMSDA